MRSLVNPFAVVFALLVTVSTAVSAPREGAVRGEVTDLTGGVLPGVSVTTTAAGGRLLNTAVTDATGSYLISALPAGPVTLTFHLDGFALATMELSVQANSETYVVERLAL